MADKKISALTAATTPLAGTEVLPIVQSSTTKQVSVANLTTGRDISTTGITVSSNTGNIELNWATGSTHKVGSTFSTSFFTGMRVDADTRNTDIVSFDASGIGNVRIRTGTTETTRLNVDPTGNVTVSTGNLVIGTSGKGIDFAATPGTGTSELLADYEEGTWTPIFGGSTSESGQTYDIQTGRYIKVGKYVFASFDLRLTALGTITGNVQIKGLPYTQVNGFAAGCGMIQGFSAMTTSYFNLLLTAGSNSTVCDLWGQAGAGTSVSGTLAQADLSNTTRINGAITFIATT
jgi:hypothetical protein